MHLQTFLKLPQIDNLLAKWPIFFGALNHINFQLFLADFDWTSRQCWICSCNVPNWTLCAFWRLENHFSSWEIFFFFVMNGVRVSCHLCLIGQKCVKQLYYVLLLFYIIFWIHIMVYNCWKATFLKVRGVNTSCTKQHIYLLMCFSPFGWTLHCGVYCYAVALEFGWMFIILMCMSGGSIIKKIGWTGTRTRFFLMKIFI